MAIFSIITFYILNCIDSPSKIQEVYEIDHSILIHQNEYLKGNTAPSLMSTGQESVTMTKSKSTGPWLPTLSNKNLIAMISDDATYFDILERVKKRQIEKKNGDGNVFFQFWQRNGLLSIDELDSNNYKKLQNNDLLMFVELMDEEYSRKAKYMFNINNHIYNDQSQTTSGYKKFSIAKYNIYDIYGIFSKNSQNLKLLSYKMIQTKDYFFNKYKTRMIDNWKDIDLIFPENDSLMVKTLEQALHRLNTLNSDGINNTNKSKNKNKKNNWLQSFHNLEKQHHNRHSHSGSQNHNRVHHININCLPNDYSYFGRNESSIYYHKNYNYNDNDDELEMSKQTRIYNNKFWRLDDHCLRRKSISVYPHLRVLFKSKLLSCDTIVQDLLMPICKCIDKYGLNCSMLIDEGYLRYVFKLKLPKIMILDSNNDQNNDNDNDMEDEMIDVVVKMMKPKFFDKINDWLAHVRESIMLQYLSEWEFDFIKNFGSLFSLSNGELRAFHFVPEWGHCIFPTFVSVSPYYESNLENFILNGHTQNITLETAADLCLQILSGLQVLHNVQGGPFMHTDIHPKQFMVDINRMTGKINILINDLNDARFKEYYFDDSGDGDNCVIPSYYCLANNHGHWRAPEQFSSEPLNELSDIWSIGLVLWSIFSFDKPFYTVGYSAVKYMIHDEYLRPNLPSNMPPFIKDVIRQCLQQDHQNRPNVNKIIQSFQYFMDNIDRLSQSKQNWTLFKLRKQNIWKETNWPQQLSP